MIHNLKYTKILHILQARSTPVQCPLEKYLSTDSRAVYCATQLNAFHVLEVCTASSAKYRNAIADS